MAKATVERTSSDETRSLQRMCAKSKHARNRAMQDALDAPAIIACLQENFQMPDSHFYDEHDNLRKAMTSKRHRWPIAHRP